MTALDTDRPGAIRQALRQLVATHGFHGASMHAVAQEAGVAAGTAYVHFESKEDLVIAAFAEIKADLGRAALVGYDAEAPAASRFRHILKACFRYLNEDPTRAKFMSQMEESPFHDAAKARLSEKGDPLLAEAARIADEANLIELPLDVVHLLTFGAVVRLVAGGVELSDVELDVLVDAMWKGIAK